MEIKTSELTGAALDWAVAKATGELVYENGEPVEVNFCRNKDDGSVYFWTCDHSFGYQPSTDWAQGGPLIDRYRPDLQTTGGVGLVAYLNNDARDPDPLIDGHGETYLEALCRSIVAYELGDTVDVPEELLG